MSNSTASDAAAESAQYDFSHGLQEIFRGWLHRLPRWRTYAFGFQNYPNKLGFRIAVGITITLVLVGEIRFQSRISHPGRYVSPQHIPEHDQRSKTRMIVLDYL
jgi:hypothetical protein